MSVVISLMVATAPLVLAERALAVICAALLGVVVKVPNHRLHPEGTNNYVGYEYF